MFGVSSENRFEQEWRAQHTLDQLGMAPELGCQLVSMVISSFDLSDQIEVLFAEVLQIEKGLSHGGQIRSYRASPLQKRMSIR